MSQTTFIAAGVPEVSNKRSDDLKTQIQMLMGLPTDDPHQGWRVIATYQGSNNKAPGYRSAHARAGKIRQGKVEYFNQYGKFGALARFMGDGMVGLAALFRAGDCPHALAGCG